MAEKTLTPEEYLALSDKEKADISSVRIMPPSFDKDNDFGGIAVKLKRPTYTVYGD